MQKRWLIRGGVALVFAASAFFLWQLDTVQSLSWESLKALQHSVAEYYQRNPLLSMAIYFSVYVVATAFSVPGAVFITLLGGAVFGLWTGFFMVSFASSLGASCAFLVARFLIGDWIMRRYSTYMPLVYDGFKKEGSFYVFAMRLIPIFPFFVVNIITAFVPISIWRFYWVSQLGMMPATFVYVYAGTQLSQLETPYDIMSPSLIAAFVLLGIFPLVARFSLAIIRKRRGVMN